MYVSIAVFKKKFYMCIFIAMLKKTPLIFFTIYVKKVKLCMFSLQCLKKKTLEKVT